MPDLFTRDWKRKLKKLFLGADAWIDFSLFKSATGLRESWERFSTAMDKFHVAGWRRMLNEIVSEGATLGTAGLVLTLALALPAFRETSDDDWLKKSELAVTFLDRYGNEIGTRGIRHNDSVPLDQFPDHLIKAVIATEDRRFYDHFGIDIAGTARALVTNVQAGGVRQGGSSITQQLAKNLFLNNERTLERKIKEAFLAMWLEARLTKNEILKLYLDRAYMGGGAFGVDAAALYYFNKSARDVDLAEAAMLAGLFKAPTKFSPNVNLPAARARANVVLDRLVESGFMTEGQVFGARRHPATPVDRRDDRAPNYYLDWAFDDMKKLVDTFPKSMTERVFVVRTALDPGMQRAADLAVENSLRQYGQEYHANQAAAVLMDVDGAVRAMVGGRDYGASQFNRATDSLRQPGSSFKPYVYATALMHGMKPSSTVIDGPICIGNWCPHNYGGGYHGAMSLIQALTHSVNTVAIRLSIIVGDGNAKLGRARIIETAHKMGIRTPLPDTPSLPIGADGVALLDHTGAYATFPNLGMKVTPHAILEVRTGGGKLIWRYDRDGPKPVRVLPAHVAQDMITMMNSVVENGTGRRARLDGITAAGKTGTTNAYRDAWFMGYTANFVCGIWIGNDNYETTNRMTGGSLPAMTWHSIMAYAHEGVEVKQLPGIPVPHERQEQAVAFKTKSNEPPPPPRPVMLTKRGADILVQLERMMDDANRALGPLPPTVSTDKERQAQAGKPGAALAADLEGQAFGRN
ncbi:MAG TPA: PBP1A family penicillin-binding protein [Pseudolabrys sp.]|nr:PBP1A family penicillin-binding protein [Pseudolabrys sp.]HZT27284.1 PBP1A family penicillin-binding protein [Pseudolabrys sp.]